MRTEYFLYVKEIFFIAFCFQKYFSSRKCVQGRHTKTSFDNRTQTLWRNRPLALDWVDGDEDGVHAPADDEAISLCSACCMLYRALPAVKLIN